MKDYFAEAMREWKQKSMGTAATPPPEFVLGYVISEVALDVDRLAKRVALLEDSAWEVKEGPDGLPTMVKKDDE